MPNVTLIAADGTHTALEAAVGGDQGDVGHLFSVSSVRLNIKQVQLVGDI